MGNTNTAILVGTAVTSGSSGPTEYPVAQVPGFDNPTTTGNLYERCNTGNADVTGVIGGYSIPARARIPDEAIAGSPWNGTVPDFINMVFEGLDGLYPGLGTPCVETYSISFQKITEDGAAYPDFKTSGTLASLSPSEICTGDSRLASSCGVSV